MTAGNIIGPDAERQLQKMWREHNRRLRGRQTRRRYWHKKGTSGGGSGGVWRVQLVTVDCENLTATVLALSEPCDTDLDPPTEVVDKLGCLLNERADLLVGRKGYCCYNRTIGIGGGDCEFELVNLCCDEDTC